MPVNSFAIGAFHHFHNIDHLLQISQIILIRFYFWCIDCLQRFAIGCSAIDKQSHQVIFNTLQRLLHILFFSRSQSYVYIFRSGQIVLNKLLFMIGIRFQFIERHLQKIEKSSACRFAFHCVHRLTQPFVCQINIYRRSQSDIIYRFNSQRFVYRRHFNPFSRKSGVYFIRKSCVFINSSKYFLYSGEFLSLICPNKPFRILYPSVKV